MESMNGINESCFLPFKKAAHIPAHNTAEMSEIDGKPVIRPLRENEKAPVFPGHFRSLPLSVRNESGGGGNRTPVL